MPGSGAIPELDLAGSLLGAPRDDGGWRRAGGCPVHLVPWALVGLVMPMAGLVRFSDAEPGSKRGCWRGESLQTRQVWARSRLQSGCTNSRSFPKLHLTFN